MTTSRATPEQNPLLLLGAFAVIAALLFALFRFTGTSSDPEATRPGDTGSTGTPATPSATGNLADEMLAAPEFQRGQVVYPKGSRKGGGRSGPELAPASTGRSGSGTAFGQLPTLDLPVGPPMSGSVTTSVANIPNRTANGGFSSSMRTLTGGGSDFVILNEVSNRRITALRGAAPGYDAYRDPQPDRSRGGSQSMNNVVMWRTDRWTMIDAGRVKVVDDDRGVHAGQGFVWDRYATWVVFQRADGAIISVVSTHMPTNPAKFPAGGGESRISRYARGMDVLAGLARVLAAHGPVLVGGDMNSHHRQGGWTAGARMTAAGFRYTKDRGVMHLFFQRDVALVAHRQVGVASDHPAIITTLDMDGAGPS